MSSNLATSRSKFLGLSVTVLLVLVSLCAACYSPLALAQDGNTSLSGYVLPQVASADAEGRTLLNPISNEDLNLNISLKVNDYDGLQKLVEEVSTPGMAAYRQFLTPQQFAARFSPSQAEYDEVVGYFKQNGFQVTQTYPNRLGLEVKASSQKVASTLHTSFVGFEDNNKSYFSVNANPVLPSYIASKVQFISGLTNFYNDKLDKGLQHGDLSKILDASPGFKGYSPNQFRKAYNAQPLLDAGVNGAGSTIGIMLPGAYFDQASLDNFCDTYGLPRITPRVVGDLVDPTNKDEFDVTSVLETMLDLGTSHGAAPGANIVLYSSRPQGKNDTILNLLFRVFQAFANDGKADVSNGSFGLAESLLPSDFVVASSQLLLQGAVQGTSEFFSSGDNGLYGEARFVPFGGDINKATAEFPTTFPFSTSVGGTRLGIDQNGNIGSETGWSFTPGIGSGERDSSGGGTSVFFRRPFYQTGFHTNLTRTVPDVAADADNETGYPVAVNAKYFGGPNREVFVVVGGTSGSSPLWTGFTALLTQALGGRLGPINPLIYDLNFSVFHDIVTGYNGTNAIPGYDAMTGMGSPDLLKLITFLPGRIYQTPLPPLATFFERVNPNVTVRPGAKVQVIAGIHNYTQGNFGSPSLVLPIPAGLTLSNARFTTADAYVASVSATEARINLGRSVPPNQTVTAFFTFDVASSVASGTVVTHRSKATWSQDGQDRSVTSNQIDLVVSTQSLTDLTQDGFFQGKITKDSATGDLVLTDSRLGINEPVTLWYNNSQGTTYNIPSGLVSSNGTTDGNGVLNLRISAGQWASGQYTLVVYGRVTGTTLLLSFSSQTGSLTPLSLKVQ